MLTDISFPPSFLLLSRARYTSVGTLMPDHESSILTPVYRLAIDADVEHVIQGHSRPPTLAFLLTAGESDDISAQRLFIV